MRMVKWDFRESCKLYKLNPVRKQWTSTSDTLHIAATSFASAVSKGFSETTEAAAVCILWNVSFAGVLTDPSVSCDLRKDSILCRRCLQAQQDIAEIYQNRCVWMWHNIWEVLSHENQSTHESHQKDMYNTVWLQIQSNPSHYYGWRSYSQPLRDPKPWRGYQRSRSVPSIVLGTILSQQPFLAISRNRGGNHFME